MASDIALFRLSVLGTLTSRVSLARGEVKALINAQSQLHFNVPNSHKTQISPRTIERWYHHWRRSGIEGLEPKPRSDKQKSKLTEEAKRLLIHFKKEDMRRSINTLLVLMANNGFKALPKSTVHRFLRNEHLSARVISDAPAIERRQFSAQHANDIWYGDVMHAGKIHTAKGLQKVYLISLMDDASRLITHSGLYFNEQAVSVECVLKEAVQRRGLPKRLIVDNGSAYRSESLQQICARLDIRLIYCRPYEPEGKGKLERWHKTVREQFINEVNLAEINSLSDFNLRLQAWLQEIYHHRQHSGLVKQSPMERFRQDVGHIRHLGEKAQSIDEILYHRIARKVSKVGIIHYENQAYEVPYQYSSSSVNLVVDPHIKQAKYIESRRGEYLAKVVLSDQQANLTRKRQRPMMITAENADQQGEKGKASKKSFVTDYALTSFQNRFKLEDK